MKYDSNYRVYGIRYFNVIFYLFAKTELDDYKIMMLGDCISTGTLMKMEDIHGWCLRQNIRYNMKFKYCKEYPIQANIWNFYSYCRFKIEQKVNNDKK